MRIQYRAWSPKGETLDVVEQADAICRDYRAQGYDLTLRQLYYQFVARGLIANNQQSYNRLGSIINKARLAGLLDWDYIVDRTRNLEHVPHWDSPSSVMHAAANGYALDKWESQRIRVEVWVEKEALAGVVSQVADRLDCAWFSCRGYVSQSELWGAAQRHMRFIEQGQRVVVLHLGDHDPSGLDMTRDMAARLHEFTTQDYLNAHASDFPGTTVKMSAIFDAMRERCGVDDGWTDPVEVRRIALNWDQVQEYDPPPNPAKLTDSRVAGYLDQYGTQSWELDALDPATLDALIEQHVLELRDEEAWDDVVEREDEQRDGLQLAARRWDDVVEFLGSES